LVPFLDLKSQYESIKPEVLAAVERVFDSTQFVLGKEVQTFEEEFASFCGARYGIAVNSGTSALHLALLAAGVGPGDEVITVPHTFVATVAAICYTGATPVFVDIEEGSYCMDPTKLEAAITARTKAIVPVHLYGQPADMDPILEVARAHNITVLEDAAQAHGAEYRGRRCGSLADMAAFSFYPGKNLGAYGEGGIVTTDDAEIARKVRMLRDWGQEKKYHHEMLGFNARMDGVQGAILRVKLRHLDSWTDARRARAKQYDELLSRLSAVITPKVAENCKHVYHIYCVRVRNRDSLMQYLKERDIHTGIHYPFAVHTLPGYRFLGYKEGEFPVAETVATQVVSLPMYPEMTPEMVSEVCDAVREWAANQPSVVREFAIAAEE
jgi:dTDP-4-amino-4,6-dideoxygalactose transaminase